MWVMHPYNRKQVHTKCGICLLNYGDGGTLLSTGHYICLLNKYIENAGVYMEYASFSQKKFSFLIIGTSLARSETAI
jgi:hypothetical protein